jgi:hypothetical protein
MEDRGVGTEAPGAPAQRSLGDSRVRELVDGYVAAWERNDVDAIRDLLVEEAVFAMPPWPQWWQGGCRRAAAGRGTGRPRLDADWVSGLHESNVEQARGR